MEEQGIGRPSTYAPTVSTILDREYVIKEGKYLHITNLGRVVTGLMKERFSDIADLKFTANMEKRLDSVEEGSTPWKNILREFYGDFGPSLQQAEKELEGIRIKVPDEVSEEKCDLCGRNLVIKSGRFGRFLACPGYPDCKFTKPLVVEMPGRCPKCGGRILKKTSKNGYTYYGCEHNSDKNETSKCDFMVREFFSAIGDLIHHRTSVHTPPARRLLLMVIVATLPLFIILPVKDAIESLYYNTAFIGAALIVTGVLLFFSDRVKRGRKTEKTATILDALIVGLSQVVATCPGISRSGTTICTGMAEFEDVAENVIIIDSVSKRFSSCGARVGMIISRNREMMAQALKMCQGRLCSATLDQIGAAALYSVNPEYFAAVREEYKARRDTIVEKLSAIPGVICKCPKGAFYLMASLPIDDADSFQQWLLEEFEDHGDTVMFAPGEGFYGTPGKGKNEVRLAYVLKQTDLERAMELLALGLQAYNAR